MTGLNNKKSTENKQYNEGILNKGLQFMYGPTNLQLLHSPCMASSSLQTIREQISLFIMYVRRTLVIQSNKVGRDINSLTYKTNIGKLLQIDDFSNKAAKP